MANTIQKVRIFGDSILKGIIYDKESNRYVSMEHPPIDQVSEDFKLSIHNNSLFGCTVGKGQVMLQRAIEKGLDCDTAILEYGGNDCDFNWAAIAADPEGTYAPNTPLETYATTLKSMITSLRKQRITPILMTLPPINANRYFNYFCEKGGLDKKAILGWLKNDVNSIERFQELYSLRINTVASETGTTLIDIRSGFLQRFDCASLICEDGIHPNYQGHLLIASMFSEYLKTRQLAVS
ncbi:lysophospholipase L1-like esterase [Sphaerochaeta pleomorpha str. Grapes]|uniref:Lysophospholipase L1-like esterase n=1 Tax=Sphaerochaeta pleomorpha (strain ATCC BAA-1885 / DSM 22778 / Grapes) TaxID=158190 RepID=G8QQ55_SPHPG|nr:SGNH/GDSL hydrolase family protein [Sphaerochaeta pleomorpha]AEV28632.1 lysophospholipase L1-like esterase [Sphaerochaeta pleomorpha str. Grapes]